MAPSSKNSTVVVGSNSSNDLTTPLVRITQILVAVIALSL